MGLKVRARPAKAPRETWEGFSVYSVEKVLHALEKMRRVGMCVGLGVNGCVGRGTIKWSCAPKLLIAILLGIPALAFLHPPSLHVRGSVPREGGQLLF